ncbi:hypothetical protein LFL97_32235 [Burkholderia sp. JSH-S8]|nr:hypothetical protein LFL97_32235 [Burkholderia sp. JSH-S8]
MTVPLTIQAPAAFSQSFCLNQITRNPFASTNSERPCTRSMRDPQPDDRIPEHRQVANHAPTLFVHALATLDGSLSSTRLLACGRKVMRVTPIEAPKKATRQSGKHEGSFWGNLGEKPTLGAAAPRSNTILLLQQGRPWYPRR